MPSRSRRTRRMTPTTTCAAAVRGTARIAPAIPPQSARKSTVLERAVSFAVVAFSDTGRVWQLRGHDGGFFDFHPGAGGGLRIDHKETVLRFDLATSADRPLSLYFTLGNSF